MKQVIKKKSEVFKRLYQEKFFRTVATNDVEETLQPDATALWMWRLKHYADKHPIELTPKESEIVREYYKSQNESYFDELITTYLIDNAPDDTEVRNIYGASDLVNKHVYSFIHYIGLQSFLNELAKKIINNTVDPER